jgi:hypothetical protein
MWLSQVAYNYPLNGVCYCAEKLNTLQSCLAGTTMPFTEFVNGTYTVRYQTMEGKQFECCDELASTQQCHKESGYTTIPFSYMLQNSGIPYIANLNETCQMYQECAAPVPQVFMYTPKDKMMTPFLIASAAACSDAKVRVWGLWTRSLSQFVS